MTSDRESFDLYPLLIGALALVALATFVMALKFTGLIPGGDRADDESLMTTIEDRIRPFGRVLLPGQEAEAAGPRVPEAAPAEPVATSLTGPQVYNEACITCHGSGIGGAPILADAPAWGERIAQGPDTLYDHAINGYTGSTGYMPEKGGRRL